MRAQADSASRERWRFPAARGSGSTGGRAVRYLMVLLFGGLGGCVADGGYVGGGGAEVGYGVDYYEPYGYEYYGCCDRYYVGPPRRDFDRDHPDHHDEWGHRPDEGGRRPDDGGHRDYGRPDQGRSDQGRSDQGRPGPPERRDAHPYRSAAPSRPPPSIPTGPRGGGGHPGGHGH